MKILIVGPFAGGSLPVALALYSACIRLGVAIEFLDFSGQSDDFIKARESGSKSELGLFMIQVKIRLLEKLQNSRPDILLGVAQSPLSDPNLLSAIGSSGVLLAYWFVEDYRVFTYWRKIAPCFHIFFTIQKGPFQREMANMGLSNYHYLPLAFDQHLEMNGTYDFEKMALSFMGAPYPNRVHLFETLQKFDLKVFGEGWSTQSVPGVVIGNRRITAAEARSIYRNTRINLNLHSSLNKTAMSGDFVNPRTFELAGLGCFQLVDTRELMPEHFDAGEEIVQFRDEKDLIEKISYFHTHAEAREAITEKSKKRVFEQHLYEHRVLEMVDCFQRI
jgi:spore maturation protein CgeB